MPASLYLIKQSLTTDIQAIRDSLPLQAHELKDKVIVAYYKQSLDDIELAISDLDDTLISKQAIEKLTAVLAKNWIRIQGTIVSYTALPHSEVTKLWCDLATHIGVQMEKSKKEGEEPSNLLTILMPGCEVSASEADDYEDIVPYKDHIKNQWLKPKIALIDIIKSHIEGFDSKFLVPVKQIIEIYDRNSLIKRSNIYRDPDNYDDREEDAELSDDEVYRLENYSIASRALVEAQKSYNKMVEDDSNLLGQLLHFQCQLSANSVGGVGSEEQAGVGTDVAILRFLAWYDALENKTIPEKVDNFVNKTRQFASPRQIKYEKDDFVTFFQFYDRENVILDKEQHSLLESMRRLCESDVNSEQVRKIVYEVMKKFDSTDANSALKKQLARLRKYALVKSNIADVNTCAQTLSGELATLIREYGSELLSITISDIKKTQRIKALEKEVKKAKNSLNDSAGGSDKLPITLSICRVLGVNLKSKALSLQEVSQLDAFSLKNILDDIDVADTIISKFKDFDGLVDFIINAKVSVVKALLAGLSRAMLSGFFVLDFNEDAIMCLIDVLDSNHEKKGAMIRGLLAGKNINIEENIYKVVLLLAKYGRYADFKMVAEALKELSGNYNSEMIALLFNELVKDECQYSKTVAAYLAIEVTESLDLDNEMTMPFIHSLCSINLTERFFDVVASLIEDKHLYFIKAILLHHKMTADDLRASLADCMPILNQKIKTIKELNCFMLGVGGDKSRVFFRLFESLFVNEKGAVKSEEILSHFSFDEFCQIIASCPNVPFPEENIFNLASKNNIDFSGKADAFSCLIFKACEQKKFKIFLNQYISSVSHQKSVSTLISLLDKRDNYDEQFDCVIAILLATDTNNKIIFSRYVSDVEFSLVCDVIGDYFIYLKGNIFNCFEQLTEKKKSILFESLIMTKLALGQLEHFFEQFLLACNDSKVKAEVCSRMISNNEICAQLSDVERLKLTDVAMDCRETLKSYWRIHVLNTMKADYGAIKSLINFIVNSNRLGQFKVLSILHQARYMIAGSGFFLTKDDYRSFITAVKYCSTLLEFTENAKDQEIINAKYASIKNAFYENVNVNYEMLFKSGFNCSEIAIDDMSPPIISHIIIKRIIIEHKEKLGSENFYFQYFSFLTNTLDFMSKEKELSAVNFLIRALDPQSTLTEFEVNYLKNYHISTLSNGNLSVRLNEAIRLGYGSGLFHDQQIDNIQELVETLLKENTLDESIPITPQNAPDSEDLIVYNRSRGL